MFDINRAGKKKALTDYVDIIPFAGQKLRELVQSAPVSKPNVVPTPTQSQALAEKKTAKVPVGIGQTELLSIKDIIKQKQSQHPSEDGVEVSEENPFTMDDLRMAWKKYAFKMKGRGSYYSSLIKHDPVVVNELEIQFEIDNKAQEEHFAADRINLLTHLRNELKNTKITLSIVLSDAQVNKYLSNPDKFKQWAQENKHLETLRRMFNLDIDY